MKDKGEWIKMTILELEKSLQKIKVPNNCYSIVKGGLPNEMLCLTKEGGSWIVYYSERGNRTGLTAFKSESEACIYFYNKLKVYGRK